MNERIFTSKTGKELTLRRPSYKTFRNIAAKVSALMEVEPEAMLIAPEFEQVLQACTVQNIDEWLGECDYQEAVALWDAVIEHGEFEAFFAERQRLHFEASKARNEMAVELQAAQIESMKNAGLLPPDYSLSSVLSADMSLLANPMTPPSSSTITPAGTDGVEPESSGKTSGSSSATTQRPSGGGKRKTA